MENTIYEPKETKMELVRRYETGMTLLFHLGNKDALKLNSVELRKMKVDELRNEVNRLNLPRYEYSYEMLYTDIQGKDAKLPTHSIYLWRYYRSMLICRLMNSATKPNIWLHKKPISEVKKMIDETTFSDYELMTFFRIHRQELIEKEKEKKEHKLVICS